MTAQQQDQTRRAQVRLAWPLILIPWLAVSAILGLRFVRPELTHPYALYPLLVSMVVLGLPHGALDHLVPARLGLPWARWPFGVGLYLLAYVALAALYFGLWLLVPQLAFTGFLLITVWHWGQGDQRFLEIFLGRLRPTRWGTWVTVLVRGALPIAVPILAFPETAESLYHHAALGLGLAAATTDLSSAWITVPLFSLLGLALTAYVVNAVRAAPNAVVFAVDALELFLLTALFALVPAYLAIGVYFTLWHSLRHLARLLILDRESRRHLDKGELVGPVWHLTLDLLPITLVALTLLGGLYLMNLTRVATLEGFVALYLILISALTVPHAAVTALLDAWDPANFPGNHTPCPELSK